MTGLEVGQDIREILMGRSGVGFCGDGGGRLGRGGTAPGGAV